MNTKEIKLPKKVSIPYTHWTVGYDNGMKSFDPSKLSLHLEPEQKDGYLKGEILAERLKQTAPTSNVLQYLIENPSLWPEDWKGKYVYFWGTIFRGSDGYLYVRFGYWNEGEVVSDYCWLGGGWRVGSPAASLASSALGTSETQTSPSDALNLESRVKSLENSMEALQKIINF